MNDHIVIGVNVNWMGTIPKDWKLFKIKDFFSQRNEKVDDKEYPPLSVTKTGIFDQLENVSKSDDHENRKKVLKGDFVINSRSDRRGSSGLSDKNGSVSLINIVLFSKKINMEFSQYLFKCELFIDEFFRNGKGIHFDLWSTRYEVMKNIFIPIPHLDEQYKIVNHLNSIIPPIDNKIRLIKKKINCLQEYKISFVNEIFTHSTNNNVIYNKVDIGWIKKVPSHWKIKKLKYLVKLISKKSFPNLNSITISPENVTSNSGECTNFYSGYDGEGFEFKNGDILLNKLRIYLKKVLLVNYDGYSMGEMIVLRTENKLLSKYLYYLFFCDDLIDYLNSLSTGIKVPRVSPDKILSTKVVIPPDEEIKNMIYEIENKIKQIDKINSLENKRIKLLERFKNSLISEFITGKKRVV